MAAFSNCAVLFSLLVLFGIVQSAYVPVYVMLPLDTITSKGFTNPNQLETWMKSLENVGTDGVTVDVWWGLIETSAKTYDWKAYDQLFQLIAKVGLKAQPILDFHKCGGNVGDTCDVLLPSWVRSVGNSNPDIWYTDSQGHRDDEYISLFVDEQSLFAGRTPVQIYKDFSQAFYNQYQNYLGSTIVQVEIGMGPAGEMRYPSYQLQYWNFCGVGEFQSYSSYAVADLQAAANAAGHPNWGLKGGPDNAGTYSDYYVPFFTDNVANNYASDYGKFFLSWYSQRLLDHGDRILGAVAPIFANSGASIMGKVAGIHWWYKSSSHAAECTAGYYNTNSQNAYLNIANMFANHGADFDFTCLEMLDSQQPANCDCGPQELVSQTKQACQQAGVKFGGENALPFYGQGPYSQIEYASAEGGYALDSFSYLRLTQDLVNQPNLGVFQSFVSSMHSLSVSAYSSYQASTDTNGSNKARNTAIIVGSVLGGFTLFAIIVVVIIRRRREQYKNMEEMHVAF